MRSGQLHCIAPIAMHIVTEMAGQVLVKPAALKPMMLWGLKWQGNIKYTSERFLLKTPNEE